MPTKLIFVTAPLENAAVERLSADAAEGTLVAPFDLAQQATLERLRVPTLTLFSARSPATRPPSS